VTKSRGKRKKQQVSKVASYKQEPKREVSGRREENSARYPCFFSTPANLNEQRIFTPGNEQIIFTPDIEQMNFSLIETLCCLRPFQLIPFQLLLPSNTTDKTTLFIP